MSASAWREDTEEEEEEGSDGAGEDEEDADSLATVSGLHPAVSSYMYSVMGSDSDSPDSSTIKCGTWSDSNISAEQRDSSSTDSSPSSGKSHERKVQTAEDTTRCDDFQWIKSETATAAGYESAGRGAAPPSPAPDTDEEECINIVKSKRSDFSGKFCSEKPPVPSGHDRAGPGSLDRRRYHHTSRVDRDQKSKSTHNLKGHQQSPSRQYANGNIYRNTSESPGLAHSYHLDYAGNHVPDSHQADYAHPYHGFTPPRQLGDYQRKAVSYEHFNRRHEHNDPLRYGSNSMLVEGKEAYRHEYPPHPYGQYLPPYPPQYACGSRELHGSHGELHWAGPACCHHPAPPWCGCADQARYRPPYGCKVLGSQDTRLAH